MSLTLADLTELEEAIVSHANFQRELQRSLRKVRDKSYHDGKADGLDAAAKCIRELIAQRAPKPALRLMMIEGGKHG